MFVSCGTTTLYKGDVHIESGLHEIRRRSMLAKLAVFVVVLYPCQWLAGKQWFRLHGRRGFRRKTFCIGTLVGFSHS